jgi:hypothetical protein
MMAGGWTLNAAAQVLVPAGTQATLTVEYRFEARGRKQDKVDLHEWRVQRGAEVAATLVAAKPQPLPTLQAPDAAATARLQQQGAQMQKAQAQMAPAMADAMAIVARCGEDEKCIERETMKMGAAMAGSARLESDLKLGRETAAATWPGADRYQRWQSRQQTGRYVIDESWHVVHGDPMCMSLPRSRCTHDMTRKGAGDWAPLTGAGAVEVDAQAATLTVLLPPPSGLLDFVETHTTDEPAGTHSMPTPREPREAQMALRASNDPQQAAPLLTIPLKGSWRSQSGELVLPMGAGAWHGASGEGGKLVVRWRFTAQ